MGRSSRPPEHPSFTASDFLAMITTKMENLRASTADSPPPFFVSTDSIFDGFRLILETDLRRLLISCNLKSCELDPLPPFIFADVVDEIAPFLLYLFPTLKKPNLDPDLCQNYRPISNLSFLSKTLERLVSLQLLPYIEQSGLLPPSQSGFRAHHST